MPPKASRDAPPQSTSKALVAKGPLGLSGGRSEARKSGTRPSTSRARDLVLRNGKYGAAGTGEMQLFTKKLSGQEKLDLIANNLKQEAVRAPFNLELLLKKAESQFELHLSQINNLRDETYFYSDILRELEGRAVKNSKGQRTITDDPTSVASVVGYYVHNIYVLAASWKAVYDILKDLASKGIGNNSVKIQIENNPAIRQRFTNLQEVLQLLVSMSLFRVQSLAFASEHFSGYFKVDEDGYVSFDESRIRDVYKSYADSIALELLNPKPRYELPILLAMLNECFREAPQESKRFSAAMWDAVGDLAVTVECCDIVETPLIGLPSAPYEVHETMKRFRTLQEFSQLAAMETRAYGPLVQPLSKLKQKAGLAALWQAIDSVYIDVTGQTIDELWSLSEDRIPHPQWTHTERTLRSIAESGSKKSKKLLTNAPQDEDDDMPALLTVSDSSDMIEDSDDYFSSDDGGYDDSEYDTDDEDHIRELLREAMDMTSVNPELLDPDVTKEDAPEVKGNSFIKALRNLRGKLFSKDPAITVDNQPRGSYLKSERPQPKTTGAPKTSAIRPPASMAATVEDADDEAHKKKKKKKKPKKKKKKTTGDTAQDQDDDKEDEDEETTEAVPPPPALATAQANTPATPPKPKEKPKIASPAKVTPSASQQPSIYSNGSFGSTATLGTTGQSAHSYLKKEGLLDTSQGKVKSRPEPGTTPTPPTKKMFGKSKTDESGSKPGLMSKIKTNVIHLHKKSHQYITRFVSKSDEMFKGKGSMKWEHFVKAMTDIGFTIDASTAGSSVRFDPPNPQDKSITIHKPHPDSTLPPLMIKRIGKRLRDRYDWTEDQFVSDALD